MMAKKEKKQPPVMAMDTNTLIKYDTPQCILFIIIQLQVPH